MFLTVFLVCVAEAYTTSKNRQREYIDKRFLILVAKRFLFLVNMGMTAVRFVARFADFTRSLRQLITKYLIRCRRGHCGNPFVVADICFSKIVL